jgi:murein DD-endopeptidase MepM/ murein hydrolase activator NlpD
MGAGHRRNTGGTAMSWTYTPDYDLFVAKVDPATTGITDVYACKSLIQAQALLHTDQTVGQLTVSLGDQQGTILANRRTRPHPMDIAVLTLTNRHGERAIAWMGFLDTVNRTSEAGAEHMVHLAATSPMKKWEITSQMPTDVLDLAGAAMTGLKGSAILRYSARSDKCNYPGSLHQLPRALGISYPAGQPGFLIDAQADAGVQNWDGIAQSMGTDPAQQKWAAVLGSVQADSGIEWFFDELGNCVWRRAGFLGLQYDTDTKSWRPTTGRPRLILPEDIFSLDLGESDANVVTRIEVRFGNMPTTQLAPFWQAPANMIDHLGFRNLVIHAPWLKGPAAAQSLATLLGQMYAANVLIGSVTIAADASYRLGSVIEVPNLLGGTAYYYVAAVGHALTWGETWTTTLGLSYGRTPSQSFPYDLGVLKYPLQSSNDGSPQGTAIPLTFSVDNPRAVEGPFTLLQQRGLADNVAITDPQIIPAGGTFYVFSALGHHMIGEFTALPGVAGSGKTIYLADTVGYTQGLVIFVNFSGYQDESTSSASGGSNSEASASSTPSGSGADLPTPAKFDNPPLARYIFEQEFGPVPPPSATQAWEPPYTDEKGNYYPNFHTGSDFSSRDGCGAKIHAVVAGIVSGIGTSFGAIGTVGYLCSGGASCIDGISFNGFGNTVVIRSGNLDVHYSHIQDDGVQVKVGDSITAGQVIALEGQTGNAHGCHVHLGVWDFTLGKNGGWVDPRKYFDAGGVDIPGVGQASA